MRFNEFKLERFFAKYEFSVRHTISSSDCESMKVSELTALAGNSLKEAWDKLELGYTQSKGHPQLLEEIAGLYAGISAEQILAAVPQEGALIALSSILEAGDHVIIMSPAYQSLSEVPRSIGCSISELPLLEQNGRWQLDLEMLKSLIRKETKLMIFNFPHNPTGYLPEISVLNDIVDIARKAGIYIFSDEMYRLSEYSAADRLPPIASVYEKGISLSGLSKTFGLPGLRSGWLVTQDEALFRQFLLQKDYTTICGSAPGEILSIMALQARDAIVDRNLGIIRDNIGHMESFLSRHGENAGWIRPIAGPVAFGFLKNGMDAEEFGRRAIHEKSLLILPGYVFDYKCSFFRLGLGRKGFKAGLDLLEELI